MKCLPYCTHVSSTIAILLSLLQVVASNNPSATAADSHWVGDQTTEPNFFGSIAPWASGAFWEAFRPAGLDNVGLPQTGDAAIFDAAYDSPGAPLSEAGYELAHGGTIHFGDFEYTMLFSSSSFRRVGLDRTAVHPTPDTLRVLNGDWTFDFSPFGVTPGDSGSLDVQAEVLVGGGTQPASLRLTNGSVSAEHVSLRGSTVLSDATLTLDAATLKTNQLGLFDIGVLGTRGTVLVSGDSLLETGYMRVGENAGSNGLLRLSGGQARAEVNGMQIGATGTGRIEVRGGASLHSTSGVALANFGDNAHGEAFITDSGSVLNIDVGFTVGDSGDGILNIANGGKVLSQVVVVGNGSTAHGEVTVDGGQSAGGQSEWHAGLMVFGHGGGGKVMVTNRGKMFTDSDGAIVGNLVDGVGSVTVQAQSTWENAGTLIVGGGGEGQLLVQGSLSGNTVESLSGQIARDVGSQGTVKVTGAGSTWAIGGNLWVGGSDAAAGGTGSLAVLDHGVVTAGGVFKVWGDATADVSGGGRINVGEGVLPSDGTIRVGPGGTLAGNGTIIGDVLVDGGTVSPGASPGALHITGNYHQLPGGILTMEIGGIMPGTQYDQLLVTGNLLLEGAVNVAFIDGFLPHAGDTFNLFSGSTFQLTGPLNFFNAPPGVQFATSFDSGFFTVTVTAVPEPTSIIMAVVSGLLFLMNPVDRRRAAWKGNK